MKPNLLLLFIYLLTLTQIVQAQSSYDEQGETLYGLTPIRKGDKWGIMDSTGKIVAPIQYRTAQVAQLDCNVRGALLNGDYCFFLPNTDSLACFTHFFGFKDGLALVQRGNLQGYINDKMEVVLPIEYFEIGKHRLNDTIGIGRSYSYYGLINLKTNRPLTPIKYDEIKAIGNYWRIMTNYKYGLLDKNFKEIIPAVYEYICYNGYFFLKNNKEILVYDSILNNTGFRFDYLEAIKSNNKQMYIAAQNNQYDILDSNFRAIIPFEYDTIKKKKSYLLVKKEDKWGVWNNNLGVEYSIVFDQIVENFNDIYIAKFGQRYILLNETFKQVVPDTLDEVLHELDYLYKLVKNKQYGYYDAHKKKYIAPQYEGLYRINLTINSNNKLHIAEYFSIKQNNVWKLIDYSGKILLSTPFDSVYAIYAKSKIVLIKQQQSSVYNFKNGVFVQSSPFLDFIRPIINTELFLAKLNGKYGLLDTNYYAIVPLQYDSIYIDRYETPIYALLKKDNLYGLYLMHSKKLIEPKYDLIKPACSSYYSQQVFFEVCKNGLCGAINKKGELIVQLAYRKIVLGNFMTATHTAWNESIKASRFTIVAYSMQDTTKYAIYSKDGKQLTEPIFDFPYKFIETINDTIIRLSNYDQITCYCTGCSIKPSGLWSMYSYRKEIFLENVEACLLRNVKPQELKYHSSIQQLFECSAIPYKTCHNFIRKDTLAIVVIGKKYGLINHHCDTLLPFLYDTLYFANNSNTADFPDRIIANNNGKWGLFNIDGTIVLETQFAYLKTMYKKNRFYSDLHPSLPIATDTLFRFNIGKQLNLCEKENPPNGKWGIVSASGNILLPAKYEALRDFYKQNLNSRIEGVVFSNTIRKNKERSWGFVTFDQEILLPDQYKYIDILNNYLVVTDTNKQVALYSLDKRTFVHLFKPKTSYEYDPIVQKFKQEVNGKTIYFNPDDPHSKKHVFKYSVVYSLNPKYYLAYHENSCFILNKRGKRIIVLPKDSTNEVYIAKSKPYYLPHTYFAANMRGVIYCYNHRGKLLGKIEQHNLYY